MESSSGNQSPKSNYRKTALLLALITAVLALASIWAISHPASGGHMADIYQDGILLQSIDLSSVKEPYSFTVTGENGAENQIEIRPDSIGILSANCPDKLCVKQGFIHTSLLPVTCLPNHLVIQIRTPETNETTDVITY